VSPLLLEGAKVGYLAFDNGMGSDHWGMWLDIPATALFGDTLQHYTLAKARRQQCKDPRIVKKYTD